MAIQLAVASGFSVATTCSPRNFEFVKFLGAKWAVDYSDAEAVKKDLSSILEANSLVGGFDAAGFGDSTSKCAIALGSICDQTKKSDTKDLLLCTVLPFQLKDLPAGVRQAGWASSGGIFGDIDPGNEHFLRIRQAVWGEFVPKGLASGAFKPAPPVLRGGNGLEEVSLFPAAYLRNCLTSLHNLIKGAEGNGQMGSRSLGSKDYGQGLR